MSRPTAVRLRELLGRLEEHAGMHLTSVVYTTADERGIRTERSLTSDEAQELYGLARALQYGAYQLVREAAEVRDVIPGAFRELADAIQITEPYV